MCTLFLSVRDVFQKRPMHVLQAGNFLDKMVTFCVGMGIGEPASLAIIRAHCYFLPSPGNLAWCLTRTVYYFPGCGHSTLQFFHPHQLQLA